MDNPIRQGSGCEESHPATAGRRIAVPIESIPGDIIHSEAGRSLQHPVHRVRVATIAIEIQRDNVNTGTRGRKSKRPPQAGSDLIGGPIDSDEHGAADCRRGHR